MFLLLSALMAASCQTPQPKSVIGAENVVAGPLNGRTGAHLTLGDPASRVRIVLAGLPGLLYRISTPAGSGLTPRVTGRGSRIRAALHPTGADGPDEVRIVLNRDVRWDIRLPAGAGEQQLDLTRGRVTRLELGVSGLIELRLPRPAGTVPVTLLGAAGVVTLSVGSGTPTRFRLAQGAGSTTGLPAGGLEPPEWRTARDRYAVRARSAIGSLLLRTRTDPG